MNVSPDVVRNHCQFLALNYLKENYPKEKVEQLRSYLRSERTISTRSHKRYITFSSSKRQRTENMNVQYSVEEEPTNNQEQYTQAPVKEETGDAVMPNNVVLVAPSQPPDQAVIMPVNMSSVNDMSIL